jgi:hypothetical protein
MHCRMLLEEGVTKMNFRGQEARICGSRRYRECQRFSEQEQTPQKPVDKPKKQVPVDVRSTERPSIVKKVQHLYEVQLHTT